MKARVKIINSSNADAFVSIHLNYYSDNSRRGAIVFYGDEKGKLLAQNVQKFFNKLSSAKRELSPLKGDYYLLNTANCPSIICECGFLSNAEEEKLLLLEMKINITLVILAKFVMNLTVKVLGLLSGLKKMLILKLFTKAYLKIQNFKQLLVLIWLLLQTVNLDKWV